MRMDLIAELENLVADWARTDQAGAVLWPEGVIKRGLQKLLVLSQMERRMLVHFCTRQLHARPTLWGTTPYRPIFLTMNLERRSRRVVGY